MLKNYLTVAFRNLIKNRLYTAINIFGLAVGLASCILILLYVNHETSYDAWFPDAERIYQVETRFDIPGREPMELGQSPGPTMNAMLKDFSEIESAVRITGQRGILTRGADVFNEEVALADPNLFDVLDFPLVSGNKDTALADVSSVLLSESMALKLFGVASPVGQTLPIRFGFGPKQVTRDYRVVGVFKELPSNTHFDFHILVPINPVDFEKAPWVLESWPSVNTGLYLKLKPGADAVALGKALPEWEKRTIPSITFGGQDLSMADLITLSLLNITDVHLKGHPGTVDRAPGDVRAIAAFTVVAAMILLIACINFTNLATARASQRAREVALRKVLGARRSQLIFQFLAESMLLSGIAFVIALILVMAALPVYNTVLQRQLGLDFGGMLVPMMAALIVLVGLVAGLYPAMVLSGFRPARILKANKSAAAEGSGRLRSALVVVQFAISIGLLVCTTVIYTQTVFARNIDRGFDRTGMLIVRTPGGDDYKALRNSFAAEVAKLPGITGATFTSSVPTDNSSNNNIFEIPGKPNPSPLLISSRTVDYNFFDVYKIKVLAGRTFEEGRGGDDYTGTEDDKVARGGNIVLNEAALGRLGISSPQDALGKQFYIGVGDAETARQATVTVIGVVANVAYRSAREPMEPTFYERDEANMNNLTLRTDPATSAAVNAAVEKLWRQMAPQFPYRAEFMETRVNAQYAQETAEAKMFAAFSLLAIIIGALGLYGLALFSAERRTKEIGIRKVLGAKVKDVVRLLVLDFSKPVLIANLIAWPVAWFLMRDWLNGFEQRIALNPAIFGAAGFLALLVAWLTVGSHALRAGRENPIRALRYE